MNESQRRSFVAANTVRRNCRVCFAAISVHHINIRHHWYSFLLIISGNLYQGKSIHLHTLCLFLLPLLIHIKSAERTNGSKECFHSPA